MNIVVYMIIVVALYVACMALAAFSGKTQGQVLINISIVNVLFAALVVLVYVLAVNAGITTVFNYLRN